MSFLPPASLALMLMLAAGLPAAGQTASDTAEPASDQDTVDAPQTALPDMEAIVKAYQAGDFVSARIGLEQLAPDGTPNAKYRYGRILIEGRGGPRDLQAGVKWLTEAVEGNHVLAATMLAQMYLKGEGVEKNPERAVILLERAASRGDAAAQYLLGVTKSKGIGGPKSDEQAFNWFLAAAEQQHVGAQYALSLAYTQGLGTEINEEDAMRWLRMAAQSGLSAAQLSLALTLDDAASATHNPTEAQQWLRRAAEGGVSTAQRILGTKYLQGDGLEQDTTEALRWLTAAAQAGDPGAQSNLGYVYATGTGVEKNDEAAAAWYRQAADAGLTRAIVVLGEFYETGRGVPRDVKLAMQYYRVAMSQGDGTAKLRLGILVASGELDAFVAPQTAAPWVAAVAAEGDDAALLWLETNAAAGVQQAEGRLAEIYFAQGDRMDEAVALFQQAAQNGDTYAQFRLGELFASGDGVEQDYVQAHKWFNVAATHGLSDAVEKRGVISRLMTPEQIAEAQTAARLFFDADSARVPGNEQTVQGSE